MKSKTLWPEAAKGFNGLLLIGKTLSRSFPHKKNFVISEYIDRC